MSTNTSPSNRDDPDNPTNVPVPDPSTLTTAMLLREIEHAFQTEAGSTRCGEIRKAGQLPCQACVALVADFLERHLAKPDPGQPSRERYEDGST